MIKDNQEFRATPEQVRKFRLQLAEMRRIEKIGGDYLLAHEAMRRRVEAKQLAIELRRYWESQQMPEPPAAA